MHKLTQQFAYKIEEQYIKGTFNHNSKIVLINYVVIIVNMIKVMKMTFAKVNRENQRMFILKTPAVSAHSETSR